MYGFSTVDGFMDVSQGLEEMIKYVANEPSVGLFFVQQHAQNAMPNLLSLKDKIVKKTHETTLHTDDLEDSIYAVRSMTECGIPIADEMIKDINKSLHFMSTSRPRKGLIQSTSWGFQMGKSSSEAPGTFSNIAAGHAFQEGGSSRSYLSAVFNTAKQNAASLRWAQQINSTSESARAESLQSSRPPLPPPVTVATVSTLAYTEVDELPLSSRIVGEPLGLVNDNGGNSPSDHLLSTLDNYDEFKSEREVKLEEWLGELQEHGPTREASQ